MPSLRLSKNQSPRQNLEEFARHLKASDPELGQFFLDHLQDLLEFGKSKEPAKRKAINETAAATVCGHGPV